MDCIKNAVRLVIITVVVPGRFLLLVNGMDFQPRVPSWGLCLNVTFDEILRVEMVVPTRVAQWLLFD